MKKIISLFLATVLTVALCLTAVSCSGLGGSGKAKVSEDEWEDAFDFSDVKNATAMFSGVSDDETERVTFELTDSSLYTFMEESEDGDEETQQIYMNDTSLFKYEDEITLEMLLQLEGMNTILSAFADAYDYAEYNEKTRSYTLIGEVEGSYFSPNGNTEYTLKFSNGRFASLEFVIDEGYEDIECNVEISKYGTTKKRSLPKTEINNAFKDSKNSIFDATYFYSSDSSISSEAIEDVILELDGVLDDLTLSNITLYEKDVEKESGETSTSHTIQLSCENSSMKFLDKSVIYDYIILEINDGKINSVNFGDNLIINLMYY